MAKLTFLLKKGRNIGFLLDLTMYLIEVNKTVLLSNLYA